MIFVDPREGSKALVAPLRNAGLTIDDTVELPGGDLYFDGRGEKGAYVSIGIEHKTVGDLVNSLRTQRLQGHQLPEMKGVDEDGIGPLYDFAYLLIEGDLLYDARGMLQRFTSRRTTKPMGMTISELYKRLNVLHLRGGLNYVFTRNQRDSIRWIEATYHTWTDVALDEHKSHIAIYTPPTLTKPTQFEKTIKSLPDVGGQVVKAAKRAFVNHEGKPSIRRAINGSVAEWAGLVTVDNKGKSRKFGTSKATKIQEAIQ